MQRIKALICEKFQKDNRVQQLKTLSQNIVVQSAVAALVSVGLLSWLHIRPLGLLFLVTFGFWFCKTRLNIRIQTPPELQKHLQQIEQRLVNWRHTRPTMFCAVASTALGTLAIVGHLVTGSMVVMIGLIVAAVVSTKYNLRVFQIEQRDIIQWPEKLRPDVDMDDEFMPEVNETNMFVLERASDLASLTSPTDDAENDEDKSDEVPSELLIPDSIPEIDENSTDDEQDDLMPIVKVSKSESEIKPANSSSSSAAAAAMSLPPVKYTQSGDSIEFKKGHFKRDSSLSTTSSSSEESLSKGLKFPDHTAVDGGSSTSKSKAHIAAAATPHNQEATDMMTLVVKAQTQALLANSSKLIPTLVSGLVQNVLGNSGPAAAKPMDSSDESDFEILEDEDFK